MQNAAFLAVYELIPILNTFRMNNFDGKQMRDDKIKMNRLKVVLAEKDITHKALAEMVNKRPNTITRICNNESQPTIKFLREIAIALGVNVQELLMPTPTRSIEK